MQPSLVISALALAVLLESSERGRGKEGREKALMLRDMEHTYLVTSWNAGSTDPALAQAAMVSVHLTTTSFPPCPLGVAVSDSPSLFFVVRQDFG